MRYLYKILLVWGVIISFGNASLAAPVYSSVETGKVIPKSSLADALKKGGVIVTLNEGDKFVQNGFEVAANNPSKIYLTNNNGKISTAVLDGIIESANRKIESGEVFVHNIETQKTETYEFDTNHFLEKTGLDLPPATQNKLNKIAQTQEKKKFFGLLETAETPVNIASQSIDTVIASLENQGVIEARINNETFNLNEIRSLVTQGILPLHILITWGAGASDLDVHLTGPDGDKRFHLFHLNKGSLTESPNAAIIDDCISTNCSEVIRVEELKTGGVYRASVFNFGDNSTTSNNLSTTSNVTIELVRGGTVVPVEGDTDLGSLVSGGESLFKGSPTTGEIGNTWKAIEINPENNDINFVNEITNSVNEKTGRPDARAVE